MSNWADQFAAIAILLAVLATFCALQVLVCRRRPGPLLAWLPGALVAVSGVISVIAALGGSNLWPLGLMLAMAFAFVLLLILLVASLFSRNRK